MVADCSAATRANSFHRLNHTLLRFLNFFWLWYFFWYLTETKIWCKTSVVNPKSIPGMSIISPERNTILSGVLLWACWSPVWIADIRAITPNKLTLIHQIICSNPVSWIVLVIYRYYFSDKVIFFFWVDRCKVAAFFFATNLSIIPAQPLLYQLVAAFPKCWPAFRTILTKFTKVIWKWLGYRPSDMGGTPSLPAKPQHL